MVPELELYAKHFCACAVSWSLGFAIPKNDYFKSGFLKLDSSAILGQVLGAVLYIVRCLDASPAPAHSLAVASPPPVITTKNVSVLPNVSWEFVGKAKSTPAEKH